MTRTKTGKIYTQVRSIFSPLRVWKTKTELLGGTLEDLEIDDFSTLFFHPFLVFLTFSSGLLSKGPRTFQNHHF